VAMSSTEGKDWIRSDPSFTKGHSRKILCVGHLEYCRVDSWQECDNAERLLTGKALDVLAYCQDSYMQNRQ
jgi:hypothetical protein